MGFKGTKTRLLKLKCQWGRWEGTQKPGEGAERAVKRKRSILLGIGGDRESATKERSCELNLDCSKRLLTGSKTRGGTGGRRKRAKEGLGMI